MTWTQEDEELLTEPVKAAKTLRLRLQIDVKYDITDTDQDEEELYLLRRLDSIAYFAADKGMLTGDSSAEVEVWRSSVMKLGD